MFKKDVYDLIDANDKVSASDNRVYGDLFYWFDIKYLVERLYHVSSVLNIELPDYMVFEPYIWGATETVIDEFINICLDFMKDRHFKEQFESMDWTQELADEYSRMLIDKGFDLYYLKKRGLLVLG